MKIAVNDCMSLVARYIDEVMAPKSEWMQIFGVSAYANRFMPVLIDDFVRPLQDENGMIETDHLRPAMETAIKHKGNYVIPVINWIIGLEDFDKIVEFASNGSGKA